MSIDKLKEAAVQEINKYEKKIVSLKKDIDKLERDKALVESDILDAKARKAAAFQESTDAVKKRTEVNVEIKKLRHERNAIVDKIKTVIADSEKREIILTEREDEIAMVQAEVDMLKAEAKQLCRDYQSKLQVLERERKVVDEVNKEYNDRIIKLEQKEDALAKSEQKVHAMFEDANKVKQKIEESKTDAELVLKECEAEKKKYIALNRGLEVKTKEKNDAILKSQELINGLQNRELAVKQAESFNKSESDSLKVERNRLVLQEAKIKKILDSLVENQKVQDQLKQLGINL